MSDDDKKAELSRVTQYMLIGVAGISLAFAILHVIYPDRFDEKTAIFLVLAIVALVIHQITKFKGFGIEIEKDVQQLKEAFGDLEKQVGPGSKTASTQGVISKAKPSAVAQNVDQDDPNKGQFGGQAENNGRKLTATIEPVAGSMSSRCKVKVRVTSTDPARPLTGKVKMHLHPTFGRWTSYEIQIKGGVAEDEFVSYGAFTIGAEADNGKTLLELDLIDVPGGTKRFYEQ